jgi:hypothetical protein
VITVVTGVGTKDGGGKVITVTVVVVVIDEVLAEHDTSF